MCLYLPLPMHFVSLPEPPPSTKIKYFMATRKKRLVLGSLCVNNDAINHSFNLRVDYIMVKLSNSFLGVTFIKFLPYYVKPLKLNSRFMINPHG